GERRGLRRQVDQLAMDPPEQPGDDDEDERPVGVVVALPEAASGVDVDGPVHRREAGEENEPRRLPAIHESIGRRRWQDAAHLSFFDCSGTSLSTDPTMETPASIRPWTRSVKAATRVEPLRATATAAPVLTAIMAASSPTDI